MKRVVTCVCAEDCVSSIVTCCQCVCVCVCVCVFECDVRDEIRVNCEELY